MRHFPAIWCLVLISLTASLIAGAETFQQAPGNAMDVATGPSATLYAIGPQVPAAGDGYDFRWDGTNWQRFSGYGIRIAVDSQRNPWIVNSLNEIWQYQSGVWHQRPGFAIDIAAGGGKVFIIGTDNPAPGNGSVFRWNGQEWDFYGGYGSRIAVDNHGRPWIVNSLGEIWRNRGPDHWEILPGGGRAIDIGPSGRAYVIGTDILTPTGDGGIYRWGDSQWTQVPGFGIEIAVDSHGKPIIINTLNEIWGPFEEPPSLEDFGHRTIRMNRQFAIGDRAMLVILMQYADFNFRDGHTPSYYDGLFFGIGRSQNVLSYFRENSRGRFTIYGDQSSVGPVSHPETLACAHRRDSCPGNDGRSFLWAYQEVLTAPGMEAVRWSNYDRNRDGRITDDELILVFVQALPIEEATGGINRWFPRDRHGHQAGCAPTLDPTTRVCTLIALVGEGTGFATIAHEVSHSFGTHDLRGAFGRMNYHYTLMGSTILPNEDVHETFHLDPWHKIALGWVEPEVVAISPMSSSITRLLSLPTLDQENFHPILFYDPARGPREYFLVEFRNRFPGTFDADLAAPGIVVWAVKIDRNKIPVSRPAFVAPGPDGRLQTQPNPLSDDVVVPGAELIAWGPNQILETRPRGNDFWETDVHNFVTGPNGQHLGAGPSWLGAPSEFELRWPDGQNSGLKMELDVLLSTPTAFQVHFSFE